MSLPFNNAERRVLLKIRLQMIDRCREIITGPDVILAMVGLAAIPEHSRAASLFIDRMGGMAAAW